MSIFSRAASVFGSSPFVFGIWLDVEATAASRAAGESDEMAMFADFELLSLLKDRPIQASVEGDGEGVDK